MTTLPPKKLPSSWGDRGQSGVSPSELGWALWGCQEQSPHRDRGGSGHSLGSVSSGQVLAGEQPPEKCSILASVSECSKFSYFSPLNIQGRNLPWKQKRFRVGVDKRKWRSKTVQASAGLWVNGWRDIAIFNPWESVQFQVPSDSDTAAPVLSGNCASSWLKSPGFPVSLPPWW